MTQHTDTNIQFEASGSAVVKKSKERKTTLYRPELDGYKVRLPQIVTVALIPSV